MNDPSMTLMYVHDTAIGYARYGVKLAEALQRAGVKTNDRMDEAPQGEYFPTIPNDDNHVICWVSVPSHARGWYNGQYPVMSTMWETQYLPEGFRDSMDNFPLIIVPSEHNVELFSRYHRNVVKVPLGVDTHEWKFRERVPPRDKFMFLIGGSGYRKGVDLAYAAFTRVFTGREDPTPTLVFKSPKGQDYMGPNIWNVTGKIGNQEEQDLYGMAHCYLQPSRGEGWGLQPLQAIAQGLPTILTNAHGHAEFAHLGYGISAGSEESAYFIHGPAGDWWAPSLDELCEYMEYVYNNYAEACDFARLASVQAHEQFSWERCAENFVDAIGMDRLTARCEDHSWYTPAIRRYLTRVQKPWSAQIAGLHYQMQQYNPDGKDRIERHDYWETADVKRILFESEVLHPSCIVRDTRGELTTTETGLAQEQLDRMEAYSASMSYCHACHQKLNSGEIYQPKFEDDE
jgi:hypothetical protein